MSKKEKALTKRMRKLLDEDKRRQENEARQAFFKEFWPDNVWHWAHKDDELHVQVFSLFFSTKIVQYIQELEVFKI